MIAGRYEPVGDGLARDAELGRTVRLRWIESTDDVDDPRLSHPNVVRVFDVGEHDGRRFAAVEHVQGLPLALVAPLPADDAVQLGIQATRALAAAHDLGLVHEGEILVRGDGVPKLAGFRHGTPGPDVRALAEALNDASPELPPLAAETTTQLALELERARPKAAAATVPLRPVRVRRRPPLAAVLGAVALAALAIGLVAAFTGGSSPRVERRLAPVQPVPPGSSARQEAANLSAWLTRYSK
ncbi:MAG: hypothetical protein ABUS54_06385 [Actinomycetota bacterium]